MQIVVNACWPQSGKKFALWGFGRCLRESNDLEELLVRRALIAAESKTGFNFEFKGSYAGAEATYDYVCDGFVGRIQIWPQGSVDEWRDVGSVCEESEVTTDEHDKRSFASLNEWLAETIREFE
jgi:hypothetical protein